MKKYKLKKLNAESLRESEGKIATENMFIRDTRLALMFIRYMLKNIKYLKRYETDKSRYDELEQSISKTLKELKSIDKSFKKYNKGEKKK